MIFLGHKERLHDWWVKALEISQSNWCNGYPFMSKDPCRPHTGNTQWSMWVCLLTWDCLSHYNFHNMAYKKSWIENELIELINSDQFMLSIPIQFQFKIFQFNSNSIHAELSWIDYQFQFNSWIDPSPVPDRWTKTDRQTDRWTDRTARRFAWLLLTIPQIIKGKLQNIVRNVVFFYVVYYSLWDQWSLHISVPIFFLFFNFGHLLANLPFCKWLSLVHGRFIKESRHLKYLSATFKKEHLVMNYMQ